MEREVRANLVYRMFTRIDAGEVPDAKTILKIARALGPEVIEQLHRQVVAVAKRAGVTHGRRFRIDTTVVETNVHYPTDSTLLQDGVRVLTRTMQRASAALGDQPGRIRNRLRSVTRRVLTIGYQARSPKTRTALVQSYRTLMATTRAVQRDAVQLRAVRPRAVQVIGSLAAGGAERQLALFAGESQRLGLADQRPCQEDALLLAAGQVANVAPGALGDAETLHADAQARGIHHHKHGGQAFVGLPHHRAHRAVEHHLTGGIAVNAHLVL